MSGLADQTVGFIGLGLMGAPMARNLQAAGARLILYNRSEEKARQLAGPDDMVVAKPRQVGEAAEIIIVMLADTKAVQQVLFGRDGLTEGLGKGAQVIDMGTTDVKQTRQFALWIAEAGAYYVDAPVSGGTVGAEAGDLTIMAGGEAAAVARARPVFEALGARFTHVGDVGAGQVAKAANQVIVGLTIGAVAEALALAKAAGVDPERVREALVGGFADSPILHLHGKRMATGDFTPGGKARTQAKDLKQALDLARENKIDLPATRLCLELYERLLQKGDGDLDHSALYRLYVK